jgi:hypothetical protein
MPKGQKKEKTQTPFRVVVGEVDPYYLLAAQLRLLGASNAEATRRAERRRAEDKKKRPA